MVCTSTPVHWNCRNRDMCPKRDMCLNHDSSKSQAGSVHNSYISPQVLDIFIHNSIQYPLFF